MLDQKKTFLNLMEAAADAAPERLNAALKALQGSAPDPRRGRNDALSTYYLNLLYLHQGLSNLFGGGDDAQFEFLGELFWRMDHQTSDIREAALLTLEGRSEPDETVSLTAPETKAFLRLAELAADATAADLEAACKLLAPAPDATQ